jgi:hypothetical protein
VVEGVFEAVGGEGIGAVFGDEVGIVSERTDGVGQGLGIAGR